MPGLVPSEPGPPALSPRVQPVTSRTAMLAVASTAPERWVILMGRAFLVVIVDRWRQPPGWAPQAPSRRGLGWPARPGGRGAAAAQQAADAAGQRGQAGRQHEQHGQQDGAGDERGARGVDLPGEHRDQHEVEGAQRRPDDAGRAADDHRRDQVDRGGEDQRLGRGVLHDGQVHEAREAAQQRGDGERQHLGAVGRDPHRQRDGLVLLHHREGAADPAAHQVADQQEDDDGDAGDHVVAPLVVRQPGRLRRAQEAHDLALRAAGELVQPPGQRHADDRQGDGDHRQGETAQPGRGQRDEHAHHRRQQGREHQRQPQRPAVDHAVGRHVGTQAQEGALAQRDLPVQPMTTFRPSSATAKTMTEASW